MTAFVTWLVFILVIIGATALGVGIETWLSPKWGVVARIIGLAVTLVLCFVITAVIGAPGAS